VKAPMRAVVYCRVSTHEQASANHYSIPNQKKRARDVVKRRGWTVLEV
jgi:DNA invertase Pin-like site-specific DNA recombinase